MRLKICTILLIGLYQVSAHPSQETEGTVENAQDRKAAIASVLNDLKTDLNRLSQLVPGLKNPNSKLKSLGKRPIGRQEEDEEEAEVLVQVGQLFGSWFAGDLRDAIRKVSTEFLQDKDRRNEFVKTLTKAPSTARTQSTTPTPEEEITTEAEATTRTPATTTSTTTEKITTSTRFRYKINKNKHRVKNTTPLVELDSEIYSLNATDLLL